MRRAGTTFRLAAIAAWLALPPGAALAQSPAASGNEPAFGYYDFKTGAFTPAPPPGPAAAASIRRQGTIKVEASFTIEPSLAGDANLFAVVTAGVTDASGSGGVGFEPNVSVSGNIGKISVELPYLVAVASTATPMVVSLQVAARAGNNQFLQLTKTIPLPANGKTTLVTFSGAL